MLGDMDASDFIAISNADLTVVVYAAMMAAICTTGSFIYGCRLLIRNEHHVAGLLCVMVPLLAAGGASFIVMQG